MGQWQLHDAEARFSELIKSVHDEGPQQVTVRGKPSVVVISVEEYEAMKRQRPRFVELLHSSPLVGENLTFERAASMTREL